MVFDGILGGGGAEHHWQVDGNLVGPFLIAVTKQYGVAHQDAKYIINHAGIKGLRKTPGCRLRQYEKSTLQY